ncbi:hypothetical protein GCM10010442_21480 [Kitasatospora kifunensis]
MTRDPLYRRSAESVEELGDREDDQHRHDEDEPTGPAQARSAGAAAVAATAPDRRPGGRQAAPVVVMVMAGTMVMPAAEVTPVVPAAEVAATAVTVHQNLPGKGCLYQGWHLTGE